MSTEPILRNDTSSAPTIDMKLEVLVIPVSDVERAKEFYGRLMWSLDLSHFATAVS